MTFSGEFNPKSLNSDNYRLDRWNPYPGVYRARVEYRQDPLKLGRVKIRIPQRHGIPDVDDDAFDISELPWARRRNMSTGGYDTGSFIIPPVGSFVWVLYESGNPDKIAYFGGIDARNSKNPHKYGKLGEYPEDDSNIPAGQWEAPAGENEIPKDVFENNDTLEPTVDIIHKSEKGHTIKMENEDERENLSLIDRAGQIIGFSSPIKEEVNRSGDDSFKRGTKNSVKGDQFDYKEDVVDRAVVYIKDLASQVFRMVSEWTKEKIELVSRSVEDKRRSVVKLAGGEEELTILLVSEDDDKSNQNYIKFDPNNMKQVEIGAVVEGEMVAKKVMSDSETTLEVWNRPYELTVYDTSGPGDKVSWDDGKEEEN